MKHAILILAHKQIELLCRLIRYFNRACDVFVRIEKIKRMLLVVLW